MLRVNFTGGKDKDWLLPCGNDAPSLRSPPDLLNMCVLCQPLSLRMLQKHTLAPSALSGMRPPPAYKKKGFGAPKIPSEEHYAAPAKRGREIPAKYTYSPAAEQIPGRESSGVGRVPPVGASRVTPAAGGAFIPNPAPGDVSGTAGSGNSRGRGTRAMVPVFPALHKGRFSRKEK